MRSPFRKIAAATWRRPFEPTIHGVLEVDMTAARAYLDGFGPGGPSINHLVVRALALALSAHPAANVRVHFGTLWPRPTIDVFAPVFLEETDDLRGLLVAEADRKGIVEVADAVRRGAEALRRGEDPLFGRAMPLVRILPGWLLRPALAVADLIGNRLGLPNPLLGVRGRAFGSAMVTSVGAFGVELGLPPLFPLADVPVILSVGRVHDRPVAVDGRVEVRPVCLIGTVFDHRVVDGALMGRLHSAVRRYLEDPGRFEEGPTA